MALRRDGMKQRHWELLSEKAGIEINAETEENFTLQSIVDRGMIKYVDACDDIGEKANKEYNIEKSLAKMKTEWQGQNFLTPEFKNTRTYIISGFDDAAALLDEHIVTGQAMQFSPFKKPFEEEIEEWVLLLCTVQDTLEEWIKCQQQWMYLQPIFDSPDIMKQLPTETKRFKSVDSKWRFTLQKAFENQNILMNCSQENLKESF
jgi:dynein heavy chain